MGDKENKRFIKKLEIHIENTRSNLKYSLDRFDILIIALSSGGLVFSMGFIKDIISPEVETNFLLLKIAWILFGSSIISNLLSQVTGYFANKLEIRITKNIIRQEREKPIKGNKEKDECNKKIVNYLTYFLNGTSLVLLIGAVILLIIFLSTNLK
jgi:hypothetical protein